VHLLATGTLAAHADAELRNTHGGTVQYSTHAFGGSHYPYMGQRTWSCGGWGGVTAGVPGISWRINSPASDPGELIECQNELVLRLDEPWIRDSMPVDATRAAVAAAVQLSAADNIDQTRGMPRPGLDPRAGPPVLHVM
jgi:hypothetical protein